MPLKFSSKSQYAWKGFDRSWWIRTRTQPPNHLHHGPKSSCSWKQATSGRSGEKPPRRADILRKQTKRPASATYTPSTSTVYVPHVCAFRKRPLSYRRPRPPGTNAGWKDSRRLPERSHVQFKLQDLQIILKGQRLFDLIPRGEFQPEEHSEASFRAANSVTCSLLDAADVFPATNVSGSLGFNL